VLSALTPGLQIWAWISITESIYFVYPISIALCKHVCSWLFINGFLYVHVDHLVRLTVSDW
jgi:hypothetical protein